MSAQMTVGAVLGRIGRRVGVPVAAHVRRDRAEPGGGEAASWWRQEYQSSGQPWHSTTGKPAPASATCTRMPFAWIDRWRMACGHAGPPVSCPRSGAREPGRAARAGRALARQPQDGREERGEDHVHHARGEGAAPPMPFTTSPTHAAAVGDLAQAARGEDGRPAAPVPRRQDVAHAPREHVDPGGAVRRSAWSGSARDSAVP